MRLRRFKAKVCGSWISDPQITNPVKETDWYMTLHMTSHGTRLPYTSKRDPAAAQHVLGTRLVSVSAWCVVYTNFLLRINTSRCLVSFLVAPEYIDSGSVSAGILACLPAYAVRYLQASCEFLVAGCCG